jgi:hypothetical protein
MFAKFLHLVAPHFPAAVAPDYLAIFQHPSDVPPLSSLIATPRIDLYFERIDLGNFLGIRHANSVQSLIILANIITIDTKKSVKLPGNQVVLIAQHLVALSHNNDVPEIEISDSAFDSAHFYFRTITGVLKVYINIFI